MSKINPMDNKDMDIFEKTRLALRERIQADPEKIKLDLARMRSNSIGRDIYSYVESLETL